MLIQCGFVKLGLPAVCSGDLVSGSNSVFLTSFLLPHQTADLLQCVCQRK